MDCVLNAKWYYHGWYATYEFLRIGPMDRAMIVTPMITLIFMGRNKLGQITFMKEIEKATRAQKEARRKMWYALQQATRLEHSVLFHLLVHIKRDTIGDTSIIFRGALTYLHSCRNCRRLYAHNEGKFCLVFPSYVNGEEFRPTFLCRPCVREVRQAARLLRIPLYIEEEYEFEPLPIGGPIQDALESQLRLRIKTGLATCNQQFEDRNYWICRKTNRRVIYKFQKYDQRIESDVRYYLSLRAVDAMWRLKRRRKKTGY